MASTWCRWRRWGLESAAEGRDRQGHHRLTRSCARQEARAHPCRHPGDRRRELGVLRDAHGRLEGGAGGDIQPWAIDLPPMGRQGSRPAGRPRGRCWRKRLRASPPVPGCWSSPLGSSMRRCAKSRMGPMTPVRSRPGSPFGPWPSAPTPTLGRAHAHLGGVPCSERRLDRPRRQARHMAFFRFLQPGLLQHVRHHDRSHRRRPGRCHRRVRQAPPQGSGPDGPLLPLALAAVVACRV